MASDGVPEEYMDVLLQEFAYDPIRLPPAEDAAQLLYNRRTLETIWISKREALNPYTRQPFDIKNVIPQTELRKEMGQYIIKKRIRALAVIPDYTKVLKKSEMRYMLKDLVSKSSRFSDKEKKHEDRWKVLWQKANLIRLYCQYREENKDSFLLIKGYEYLFKVIDRVHRVNYLSESYFACDDAEELCRELARIVDIFGLKPSDFETIPRNSVESFVSILSYLEESNYLKIGSMVLNIYCQICYAVQNNGPWSCGRWSAVIFCPLQLLVRENTKDITDEDLANGTSILQAAWMCKRDILLCFRDFVDVVAQVVRLCISRFCHNVAASPSGRRLEKALTRGLELIHWIATAEDLDYEKEKLDSLDIVRDIVGMLELVVAGFSFTRIHVRVALSIMIALSKSGLTEIRRNELHVLTEFLGSDIVNIYGASVKRLLQEITMNSGGL